jgi:hypothetical protein
MVIGEGAVLTLVGITAGIAGSLFLARFITSVVYEVSPTDPLVLGATAVILAAISVLACYAPARWASSVDPASLLEKQTGSEMKERQLKLMSVHWLFRNWLQTSQKLFQFIANRQMDSRRRIDP